VTKPVRDHAERIYAGVLGKLVGVYLGRPVEGWSYDDIASRFGEITGYVADDVGVPLVVADDDIGGTFAFFRAMEDHADRERVTAREIGDTWLNYLIEHRTILWWGGLGRSTEHTAFLRLRSGVAAPRSGSAALNGRTLAEQIGAEIFIDAFAMMHPGDPEAAAASVREAASVSHDGVAVEAAAFLGAMEALAFEVRPVEQLLDECRRFVTAPLIRRLVDDVVAVCDRERDWRAVRAWLDEQWGYDRYPGACHIVPNHGLVLAALLLGGDSFQRALTIATSAAWDTDCNAGNVGCLNGIRLGLDAITAEVDFRRPIADRLLVVTSDGGSCVSDAVQEARWIVRAAARARAEDAGSGTARFTFEYRGSTQGFERCPHLGSDDVTVADAGARGDEPGLALVCRLGPGATAAVSTPVFVERSERDQVYSIVASPTLYPGQEVRARVRAGGGGCAVRLYVLQRDGGGAVRPWCSEPHELGPAARSVTWRVPDVGVNPLLRMGLLVDAPGGYHGELVVEEVDWSGAPERFEQVGPFAISGRDVDLEPVSAWVSSADVFEPDLRCGYALSHPHGAGLATIGTRDWDDYTARAVLELGLHEAAGVVVRCVGHRRYYGAVFAGGDRLALVKQRDGVRTTLAAAAFPYREDTPYDVAVRGEGRRLRVLVDGACVLDAVDQEHPFRCGGAGFLVEAGALLVDGIRITGSGVPA
jgi:ADP-ribosylglycohydrolase